MEVPTQISRTASGAKPDVVTLLIKEAGYFASAISPLQLDQDSIKLGISIVAPKQLPKGVSEAEIIDSANSQQTSLKVIIIVVAIFMKAGSQRLISLLMVIQIVSYLPLYNVDIPAETELYIEALRQIAEFDILPTEKIKEYMVENEIIFKLNSASPEQTV